MIVKTETGSEYKIPNYSFSGFQTITVIKNGEIKTFSAQLIGSGRYSRNNPVLTQPNEVLEELCMVLRRETDGKLIFTSKITTIIP